MFEVFIILEGLRKIQIKQSLQQTIRDKGKTYILIIPNLHEMVQADVKTDRCGTSENIKVVVRCRPFSRREKESKTARVVHVDASGKSITLTPTSPVHVQSRTDTSESERDESSKTFTFDHVYSDESTQEEVYEVVAKPIVENILEGYNGTIFAYGQTGTGKTFTMQGTKEMKGIIPSSYEQIFSCVSQAKEGQRLIIPHTHNFINLMQYANRKSIFFFRFLVRCSYLEIYNENIKDLLCKDQTQFLELRENKDKEVYVKDLTSLVVVDAEDMERVMTVGNRNS